MFPTHPPPPFSKTYPPRVIFFYAFALADFNFNHSKFQTSKRFAQNVELKLFTTLQTNIFSVLICLTIIQALSALNIVVLYRSIINITSSLPGYDRHICQRDLIAARTRQLPFSPISALRSRQLNFEVICFAFC